MKDQIFLLDANNKLAELNESSFSTELQFQELLERYPQLISGSQIDPERPRKWMLISREMGVPGEEGGSNIWSLDHLFIDQDGVPTLVEVKRSTDTRLRREVVGQMLDYAANSVYYWSIEEIRLKFEYSCDKANINPELVLAELIGEDKGQEAFWEEVDTNLKAGKIRLLFVADRIPKELQRIIEFLNEQMSPAEVLGVEIKQYANSAMRTLVPRVIGKTSAAQMTKQKRETVQWTEASFYDALKENKGAEVVELVKRIIGHLQPKVSRIWMGRGKTMGSIVPILETEYSNQFFAIWTNGTLELYFQYYKAPFDKPKYRQKLRTRLMAIPGIDIPDHKLDKRPSFDLEVLLKNDSLSQFLAVYDWFLDEVNKFGKMS